MCGISCIVSGNYQTRSKIGEMTSLIEHRGRDDYGYYVDNHVALGHRRLSIIDLSYKGHQPMYDDGNYIVYNGEVYNYKEIREELEISGEKFESDSDTEVVLKAYKKYGEKCLNHFNGMFAFVIYDLKKGEIFAARDRFGVKPIYWWVSPDGDVAFASEIKQFTILPGWIAIANNEMVEDFISGGYVDHTDQTLFKGVNQLRGGEAVLFKVGDINIQGLKYKWYDLNDSYKLQWNPPFKYKMQVERFRKVFYDAVKLRLRSDVPVGSCLSGGIDSSSIVCTANDILGGEGHQKVVSSCAHDKKYDEKEYVDAVVDKTGVDLVCVYPTVEGLFETLDTIVWHQDTPLQSTSMYAQWCVFETAAKNNIPVMLDGQLSDEILFGYHYIFPLRFKSLFESLRWFQLLTEIVLVSRLPGNTFMSVVRQVARTIKNRHDIIVTKPHLTFDHSTMRASSYTLLYYTSAPALLHWEDRNSMAHTVESRLPFEDHRLVELAYALEDDYKLYDAITKRVLRDAMIGVLPDKVRYRKDKMGFVTPEEKWMKEKPLLFRQKFSDAVSILPTKYISINDMERYKKIENGEAPYDFWVWRIITLGVWTKVFNVQFE